MPNTATKPSARELRRSAKALKIRGWEDMGIKELQAAIAKHDGAESNGSATAKTSTKAKSSTKAAPAKAEKPAAKKAAPAKSKAAKSEDAAENGNPYKEGTNLWHIAQELIAGGKRSQMVKRLKRKISIKPRVNADDFDEDYELDRRVLIVGQLLRKDHGFEVTREGRGEDGTIVAVAP